MKSFVVLSALALGLSVASLRSHSGQEVRTDPQVARGRYLVHDVAMCAQCHTPRRGRDLIEAEALFGAPVPVEPPAGFDEWALRAPRIAGLPGYTDEQALRLLTEGIARDGRAPQPPMPPYRFTRADAEAVVAYLRSPR